MKIAVILPAAGAGKRFQAEAGEAAPGLTKIELDLAGRPVFLRAAECFLRRPEVGRIILAVHPDGVDDFRFRWGDRLALQGVSIVAGGRAERWETVLRALDAVDEGCTHAAIHDAARPLPSPALIDRVFEAAARFPAVIPGLPVSATLKRTEEVAADALAPADPLDAILGAAPRVAGPSLRRVIATVDRRDMVEVQTPQVFELGLLRRAYARIADARPAVTDDAGLVEALGEPVWVVAGESTNLKITRPDDLRLAASILAAAERDKAAGSLRRNEEDD